jgi:hypothetical protein
MTTYNKSTRKAIADTLAGIRVDRATQVMADETIFTVAGGNVLCTLLYGEVTTVLETAANNTKLTLTPTTGTAVDICADLNTTAIEEGGFLTVTGTLSDALQSANGGASAVQVTPFILAPGTLAINVAATKAGSVQWSLFYVPLEDGAYVTATA